MACPPCSDGRRSHVCPAVSPFFAHSRVFDSIGKTVFFRRIGRIPFFFFEGGEEESRMIDFSEFGTREFCVESFVRRVYNKNF